MNMTFASPNGGVAPMDEGSLEASRGDAESMAFVESESTRKLTENTAKMSDIDATKFDAVFFAGGFGTMWDFPVSESKINAGIPFEDICSCS